MSDPARRFELRTAWWRELISKWPMAIVLVCFGWLLRADPETLPLAISMGVLTLMSFFLPEPLGYPVIRVKVSGGDDPALELHLRSFRSPVIEDRQILRRVRFPDRVDLFFVPGKHVKSLFLQPITESLVSVSSCQFRTTEEWFEFNALLENYSGK